MRKALLLLKPQLFAEGRIGDALQAAEELGWRVADMYAVELTPENVYAFYDILDDFPSFPEMQSYLGGLSIIVSLKSSASTDVYKYEKHYPCKLVERNIDPVLNYWFGSSRMEA